MKRQVDKIIIHCADTRTDQDFSIEDVRMWHKARGWYDIGYHYYIKLDGSVHIGRSLDVIGSHCKGQNTKSIGICLEGGKKSDNTDWDKPTDNQIESIRVTISYLKLIYKDLKVHGHYEFSTKSCPNFDICIL